MAYWAATKNTRSIGVQEAFSGPRPVRTKHSATEGLAGTRPDLMLATSVPCLESAMADFELTISSSGELNGVEYVARGDGLADVDRGRIDFAVSFDPLPGPASAFGSLLSILIIPTVAFGRELDGAKNLNSLAGSNFHFTQQVGGDGVAVRARGTFRRTADESFAWDSTASGQVALARVQSVDPFAAVMIPRGPGQFVESISLGLHTTEGHQMVHIVREFSFDPEAQLPAMQVRNMLLLPIDDGRTAGVRLQADIRPFLRAHTRERTDRRSALELEPIRAARGDRED